MNASPAAAVSTRFRNRQTRKCLSRSDRDSPENSVRAGVPVQYECDSDPKHRWELTPK